MHAGFFNRALTEVVPANPVLAMQVTNLYSLPCVAPIGKQEGSLSVNHLLTTSDYT